MERRANPIESIHRGEDIRLVRPKINAAIDQLNQLGIGVVCQYTRPYHPNLVKQFRFKSDEGDYIKAVTWDGLAEGGEVLIAKPFRLRRTPFDGLTYGGIDYTYASNSERTATKTPDTETQVINPPFTVDDLVYAQRGITGGVDVVVSGEPLKWLLINGDSRAWAKKNGT